MKIYDYGDTNGELVSLTDYEKLEAENAALRRWARVWKHKAKDERTEHMWTQQGFMDCAKAARDEKYKKQAAEAENAALRARVEELEGLLAMSEEAAQDLAQSHSAGAGGGVYTVGGKETETRA
jgi:glycine/D-amino acid oxidase-like deaminating enzyme